MMTTSKCVRGRVRAAVYHYVIKQMLVKNYNDLRSNQKEKVSVIANAPQSMMCTEIETNSYVALDNRPSDRSEVL